MSRFSRAVTDFCGSVVKAFESSKKVQKASLDLIQIQLNINEKIIDSLADLYERVNKNKLFDADGNEVGIRLSKSINNPDYTLFPKTTRYGSVYPINYKYERYGNPTYDEYNAPTEVEKRDNGVTIVFFGFKEKIKTASEDAFYTLNWGKVHYFALKSDMSEKEFGGNINRYNMNPDEGVQH